MRKKKVAIQKGGLVFLYSYGFYTPSLHDYGNEIGEDAYNRSGNKYKDEDTGNAFF